MNFKLLSLSSKSNKGRQGVFQNEFRYAYDVSSLEDFAIMHISDYSAIFGVDRNKASGWRKRMSIVKITYCDEKQHRHSIYKKFRPSYCDALKGNVAVSTHALLFLKDDDINLPGHSVSVEQSCGVLYFFNHTNEVILSSFILGFVSLLLGLISIIISWIG